MSKTNRRDFMHQSGVGIAGATALTLASRSSAMSSTSRAAGANDRVRVGLIGCGGRGRYDAGVFAARKDAEVVFVADPHQQRLTQAAKQFAATATPIDDFRRILDDPSVDVVINATPVHWHAPATILACDAGKHVYVEKPCSHNVREGRLLVEAARRNNCIVQHGTQVRGTSTLVEGVRQLGEGIIGDALVAKAWNIQRRAGIGRGKPGDPPAQLDYDMWLGPVPSVCYRALFFRMELVAPIRQVRGAVGS